MSEATLENWKLHVAYVQGNTIAGYRYMDLSGVVLNRIAEQFKRFSVGPSGTSLIDPKGPNTPYEVRFSFNRIWLQFSPVVELSQVQDTAPEWVRSIAKDIEVSRFSRLALRSVFFARLTNLSKAASRLHQAIPLITLGKSIEALQDEADNEFNHVVSVPLGRYIARIMISTIRVTGEAEKPSDYPSQGIGFDVDFYWRRPSPEGIPQAETPSFLHDAVKHTQDLLKEVAYPLLSEVQRA
jgi:hypothetical protein